MKPRVPKPTAIIAPRGAWCAVCVDDVSGQEIHREPLGKGDALVTVCLRCATEVVKERDHLFGSGREHGGQHGVGEGNRNRGRGHGR